MYMPPHIAQLMPSLRVSRDGKVECRLDDLRRLLFLAMHATPVDEDWYRRAYPDVIEAIESGQVASATEHYRRSGYLEGRFPFEPTVDETWYLQRYPDVKAALRAGRSPMDHFIASGYSEGRQPMRPSVDAGWYLRTYASARRDVDAGKAESAADHYLRTGYAQGMLPCRPAL